MAHFQQRYGKDWSPLCYLAEVLADEKQDTLLRMQAARDLAPYLHPKLRSVEHALESEHTVVIRVVPHVE
jgi:hypothetical protein